MTMVAAPEIEIIEEMSREEALSITHDIRRSLSDARENILRMYRSEGYKLIGYTSFKEWADSEIRVSWQQVYNLKDAAQYSEELNLVSPTGEFYQIPVNHARQLRKLKTIESRIRAYQLAEEQADVQGYDKPTESMVKNAVSLVQSENEIKQSSYKVVRQMFADGGIKARDGKQIIQELDKLDDEPAQVYVQKLMAEKGLANPELIYPIGYKYKNERQRGKNSLVLDEIDNTGCLAGEPLHEAKPKHLKRANDQAQAQHIADATEEKRKQMQMLHEQDPENNPPPPVQVAITVWKHDTSKTFQNLQSNLPKDDLDQLFMFMAKERGYVLTEATLVGDPFTNKPVPVTDDLLDVFTFARNGLVCNQADELEMMIRVKEEVSDANDTAN